MSSTGWSAEQYERFKTERSQPFYDLLSLVRPSDRPRVIDLGCGTGELTRQLHDRLGCRETAGIDSSIEMLSQSSSHITNGLTFHHQRIEDWKPSLSYNLIFSNAALQWCDNHSELFARIRSGLLPGGQVAVQMPMNHDQPTHLLALKMASETRWQSASQGSERSLNTSTRHPEDYARLLFDLGFQKQLVNLRIYAHVLPSREHVIEWVKGTLLTPFRSRLTAQDYDAFLLEYRERLFAEIPDEQPFFFPFKRILIWAQIE
jgi:trans-aconitate 2-methyltransferase